MTILTTKTTVRTQPHWINDESRTPITIDADMASHTWKGFLPNGEVVNGHIVTEDGRMVLWDHEETLHFFFSDLTWTVKEARHKASPPPKKPESDTVKALRAAISDCFLQTDCWDADDHVGVLSPGGLVNQLRLRGLGPDEFTRDDLLKAVEGTCWSWRYRYRGFVSLNAE